MAGSTSGGFRQALAIMLLLSGVMLMV